MIRTHHFIHHLEEEFKKNLFHYLLLFTVGIFFILILTLTRENNLQQFIVMALFVAFYIGWGIVHHLIEKTLYFKIVVEYILIGAVFLFLLYIALL
ncbi:MAG TPA: hypothetical protein VJH96_00960 [Patescibacteria group bacterium]|nr:hypothetical protein [Patescibacteria group bacterium]